MIETVIPCEHGKTEYHAQDGRDDAEWFQCDEARRVRLVEVQPDYEAAWGMLKRGERNFERARWIVDAAVPGLTYRLEEVE